jgi:hypothetical protein
MRKLAIAILAFAAGAAAQTVTGTVVDGVTHAPVAGARVAVLNPRAGEFIPDTTTDSAGAFRIPNVKPGEYMVSVSNDGYEPNGALRSRPLHVEAGADPPALALTLMPYPSLRGRVLDRERHPVAKVSVALIPTHGNTPWPVATDAEGRFVFKSLPPNRYLLLANPLDSSGKGDLAPVYYPDAAERKDAQRITVVAGPDLEGYDLTLRGGAFYRVSGRVLDDRGEPAAGATVRVRDADVLFGLVTAGSDGSFEFDRIPAMNGRLSAQWKHGGTELQGYTALSVSRRELTNVEVRVGPPVAVSGTVELDGKLVAAGNSYGALEAEDGIGRVQSETAGRGFRFDDAYAGRYRLSYYPEGLGPRAGYLDAVLLGDRDMTMQFIDVAPGMQPVRIILKTGGGQVSGTVESAGDERIVVLIPAEPHLRYLPFIRQGMIQNARFQIDDIRPGDYYAVAVRGLVFLVDLQDAAFTARLLDGATPVHIEAKGAASVNLGPPR